MLLNNRFQLNFRSRTREGEILEQLAAKATGADDENLAVRVTPVVLECSQVVLQLLVVVQRIFSHKTLTESKQALQSKQPNLCAPAIERTKPKEMSNEERTLGASGVSGSKASPARGPGLSSNL
jgi:hypothetical protein